MENCEPLEALSSSLDKLNIDSLRESLVLLLADV